MSSNLHPPRISTGKSRLILRSMLIAGGLVVFKLAVFFVTNSVAILASAADSFMDLVVSSANFIFIRAAAKPADHNHPYGHGKIESLAGMIQSLLIGAVTACIALMAVRRFTHPQTVVQPVAGLVVTAVAFALNLWHARNLRSSMKATHSQLIATEYLHFASDSLMYVGVFASFLLSLITGQTFWDPLISLLIVGYLFKGVWAIFRETLAELLDEQLPDAVLKEIDHTIHAFDPRVTGYHNLRTRKVGSTKFIEFHFVLKDVQQFREAHAVAEGLVTEFEKKYPGAIVIAHAEPASAAGITPRSS